MGEDQRQEQELDLQIDDAILDDDFDAIAQTSEDLGIDESGISLLDEAEDIRFQPGFQYPALLVSGIKFYDTIKILETTYRESVYLFDVWLDLEDGNPPVKQGKLPATIETFLVMRYLDLRVTVYGGEDVVETLDLSNPNVLERFI